MVLKGRRHDAFLDSETGPPRMDIGPSTDILWKDFYPRPQDPTFLREQLAQRRAVSLECARRPEKFMHTTFTYLPRQTSTAVTEA